MKKKKQKQQKIIRNRNDVLIIIFGLLGLITLILGSALIFDLLTEPPTPIIWSLNKVLGISLLILCTSTLFHGFNPILLFKNR